MGIRIRIPRKPVGATVNPPASGKKSHHGVTLADRGLRRFDIIPITAMISSAVRLHSDHDDDITKPQFPPPPSSSCKYKMAMLMMMMHKCVSSVK